ncbi:50S ribosomal protein L29 [Candidatus Daviesbacteria bacterium]|nr:50S ribosomal protein L29 [Candidatus Daviesbacteria bacterium]
MKRQEFIEIKGLDLKELKGKVEVFKKELMDLVVDKNMKKLKDLKSISKKKKDLAKVLTVLKQKELLMELESKVQKNSEKSESQSEFRVKRGDQK